MIMVGRLKKADPSGRSLLGRSVFGLWHPRLLSEIVIFAKYGIQK